MAQAPTLDHDKGANHGAYFGKVEPMRVTNDAGISFEIKVIQTGDKYGRNDCLTHDGPIPMVEFYDARNAGKPGYDPEGYFVSRYYLSTLMASDPATGINLCGHELDWQVNAENLRQALQFAQAYLEANP